MPSTNPPDPEHLLAIQERLDETEALERRFAVRWPRLARLLGRFWVAAGSFLTLAGIGAIAWTVTDPQHIAARVSLALLLVGTGALSLEEGRQLLKDVGEPRGRWEELLAERVREDRWP